MKKKNELLTYSLALIGLFLLFMMSCNKTENVAEDVQMPTITTYDISSITQTTAACGGKVTYDGGATIKVRGVCWSTNPMPTITDNKSIDGAGPWSFKSVLKALIASTTYYVRAYATNKAGTSYGNVVSFKSGESSPITDIDGNVYPVVSIGTQVWMKENLKTTKYRDGSPITKVTSATTWAATTYGSYCYYSNLTSNSTLYGYLYNWYAVHDSRKICPTGWHVPTDIEWTQLTDYLGGESVAGGKMKEVDTVHWTSPNTGADNSSGFSGLPGGNRQLGGTFSGIGTNGYWWSSTGTIIDYHDYYAWDRVLTSSDANSTKAFGQWASGFSVRCLQD